MSSAVSACAGSLVAQFLLSSEVLTQITWPRLQANTRHYSFPTLTVCAPAPSIRAGQWLFCIVVMGWVCKSELGTSLSVCEKVLRAVLLSASSGLHLDLTQQKLCVFKGWIHKNHKPNPTSSCTPRGTEPCRWFWLYVPMFCNISLWVSCWWFLGITHRTSLWTSHFFSKQVDVYACVVLRWASMERGCLKRWASGSAVVFLHTLALSWTGKAHDNCTT